MLPAGRLREDRFAAGNEVALRDHRQREPRLGHGNCGLDQFVPGQSAPPPPRQFDRGQGPGRSDRARPDDGVGLPAVGHGDSFGRTEASRIGRPPGHLSEAIDRDGRFVGRPDAAESSAAHRCQPGLTDPGHEGGRNRSIHGVSTRPGDVSARICSQRCSRRDRNSGHS